MKENRHSGGSTTRAGFLNWIRLDCNLRKYCSEGELLRLKKGLVKAANQSVVCEAFDAHPFVLATVAIPNHFQCGVRICFRVGKVPMKLGSPICLKSTSDSNPNVL